MAIIFLEAALEPFIVQDIFQLYGWPFLQLP